MERRNVPVKSFWRGVTTSSAVGVGGVGDGRAIAARSRGLYLKLAGRRTLFIALALAAFATAFVPSIAGPAAGANYTQDVVTIEAGAFLREDIFLPTDGSPWHADFEVKNGGPIDVYVLHTSDVLAAYPGGGFTPIEFRENVTAGVVTFAPAS